MKCRLCMRPLTRSWQLGELLSRQALISPQLCHDCGEQFEKIDQHNCCPRCGRPESPQVCGDCRFWQSRGEPVLENRAVFHYNDALKELMHQYKALGNYSLHQAFYPEIAVLCHHRGTLVPLTTEPDHFARRGFDPVLGLFGAQKLALWLVKDNTDQPQSRKKRGARLRTPQSFRCVASVQAMQRVKQICLVDDLYTTGRTLHHAAVAIRAGGFRGRIIARTLIR